MACGAGTYVVWSSDGHAVFHKPLHHFDSPPGTCVVQNVQPVLHDPPSKEPQTT